MIRALLILAKNSDLRMMKEKDKILNFIVSSVIIGKYEFKKGNTLASLAEALYLNFDQIFCCLPRPQY